VCGVSVRLDSTVEMGDVAGGGCGSTALKQREEEGFPRVYCGGMNEAHFFQRRGALASCEKEAGWTSEERWCMDPASDKPPRFNQPSHSYRLDRR
jgi:hypothetical protein